MMGGREGLVLRSRESEATMSETSWALGDNGRRQEEGAH